MPPGDAWKAFLDEANPIEVHVDYKNKVSVWSRTDGRWVHIDTLQAVSHPRGDLVEEAVSAVEAIMFFGTGATSRQGEQLLGALLAHLSWTGRSFTILSVSRKQGSQLLRHDGKPNVGYLPPFASRAIWLFRKLVWDLGLCPEDRRLFPTLTNREHRWEDTLSQLLGKYDVRLPAGVLRQFFTSIKNAYWGQQNRERDGVMVAEGELAELDGHTERTTEDHYATSLLGGDVTFYNRWHALFGSPPPGTGAADGNDSVTGGIPSSGDVDSAGADATSPSSSRARDAARPAAHPVAGLYPPAGSLVDFDALDSRYPGLDDHHLTSALRKLTEEAGLRHSVEDVRSWVVQCVRRHPNNTLWASAKEFADEMIIPHLKSPAKRENGATSSRTSHASMGATASIGPLSGEILDLLRTYFVAYTTNPNHTAMLKAIRPSDSPSALTCRICAEDFDAGDIVACSGEVDIHFFCMPCLSSYCTVTVQSGAVQSMTCPIPGCKALFATYDIKSTLSEWDMRMIERREDGRDRRVASSLAEEDRGDPRGETGQWLSANSKQCPRCRIPIEKNGGCNHMTCRPPGGCGYEFWWSCRCEYPRHTCGREDGVRGGRGRMGIGVPATMNDRVQAFGGRILRPAPGLRVIRGGGGTGAALPPGDPVEDAQIRVAVQQSLMADNLRSDRGVETLRRLEEGERLLDFEPEPAGNGKFLPTHDHCLSVFVSRLTTLCLCHCSSIISECAGSSKQGQRRRFFRPPSPGGRRPSRRRSRRPRPSPEDLCRWRRRPSARRQRRGCPDQSGSPTLVDGRQPPLRPGRRDTASPRGGGAPVGF